MSDDPVSDAFEKMVQAAKKRGGGPQVRRVAVPQPSKRNRGRPTGRDGRALGRPMKVDSLGEILGKEVQRRGWEQSLASGWVINAWPELVGEQIAEHTRIEMIKGTTLHLSCDSTAWASNLRMMQSMILKTIAEKTGPGVITELKIFGPKAPSWRKGPLHVKGRGPRDTYG